jgi:hypothetical protein
MTFFVFLSGHLLFFPYSIWNFWYLFCLDFYLIFVQFQFNFSSIFVQSFFLLSFLSNCGLILDFFQIFCSGSPNHGNVEFICKMSFVIVFIPAIFPQGGKGLYYAFSSNYRCLFELGHFSFSILSFPLKPNYFKKQSYSSSFLFT